MRNIDTIHIPGQSSVAKSYENLKDLKDNILISINILNWAKKNKVKRFMLLQVIMFIQKKKVSLKETTLISQNHLWNQQTNLKIISRPFVRISKLNIFETF